MIQHGSWFILVLNVFSQDALNRAIPYIIFIGASAFIANTCMFIWPRWSIQICILNIVYHIIWVVVAFRVLLWPDLFSAEFATIIDDMLSGIQFMVLTHGEVIFLALAIIIIISVLDVVEGVVHTLKSMRKDQDQ